MNTFNMKQWLQENRVGPYNKSLLTEDADTDEQNAEDAEQETPVDESYEDWLSAKKGKQAASEEHEGIRIGDRVKVDREAAEALGMSSQETFIVKSFRTIKPGKMTQSVDATLMDLKGSIAGDVSVNYLNKVISTGIPTNEAGYVEKIAPSDPDSKRF